MSGSPPPHDYNQQPQGYQQQPQGYQQQPQAYQQYPQPQGNYPAGAQFGPVNPSAPYGVDPLSGLPYSDKQKMIAGILQLLLGAFGAGRFYTGHTSTAIAQIAVTWLTCGVGGIWPMIDGIMLLTGNDQTDSNGLPLRPN